MFSSGLRTQWSLTFMVEGKKQVEWIPEEWVEQIRPFVLVEADQSPGENLRVARREVQSLGSGRRNHVRRVAREKTSAVREAADVARVDFVGGEPFDVVNIEFEL